MKNHEFLCYKKGMKIWFFNCNSEEIGGGLYDENVVKSGLWIELHDKYSDSRKVTYQGEYKNGLKIGKWKTSYKSQELGGGQYDQRGLKSGQWIDLDDNYSDFHKVTYQGEYKNGIRIGQWTETNQNITKQFENYR